MCYSRVGKKLGLWTYLVSNPSYCHIVVCSQKLFLWKVVFLSSKVGIIIPLTKSHHRNQRRCCLWIYEMQSKKETKGRSSGQKVLYAVSSFVRKSVKWYTAISFKESMWVSSLKFICTDHLYALFVSLKTEKYTHHHSFIFILSPSLCLIKYNIFIEMPKLCICTSTFICD